jgi:hypothetical protein
MMTSACAFQDLIFHVNIPQSQSFLNENVQVSSRLRFILLHFISDNVGRYLEAWIYAGPSKMGTTRYDLKIYTLVRISG